MQQNNNDSSAPDNKNGKQNEENNAEALKQAEKDIKKDRDISPKPDPAADLDEGELARFEGEE